MHAFVVLGRRWMDGIFHLPQPFRLRVKEFKLATIGERNVARGAHINE